MTNLIGLEINGYRIIEQIGVGGMARVFKAYQPAFDRFVALKVLPDHYSQDEKYLARFQQEARIIANLEHKHILPVYDFGEDKGRAYLAMRYLQAGTLKDLLAGSPDGKLDLNDAALLIGQIAAALGYAHQKGIVHRDVKPSNILVDQHGDTFLTDFGIAKVLEATSHLTSTGAMMGTPAYMSPEQAAGKAVDGRSDIYSLGIILYQMLTGRTPFDADTPYAIVIAHINEPLPLPSSLNPAIPEEVEKVILKALAKDPGDRYKSADEMAVALEKAALGSVEAEAGKVSSGLLAVSQHLAGGKSSSEVTVDDRSFARKITREMRLAKSKPWLVAGLFVAVLLGAGVTIQRINSQSAQALANATIDPAKAFALVLDATQTARAIMNATTTQIKADAFATRTVLALTPTRTPRPTFTPTTLPREYIQANELIETLDSRGSDQFYDFNLGQGPWVSDRQYDNMVYKYNVLMWEPLEDRYAWATGPRVYGDFAWIFDLRLSEISGNNTLFGVSFGGSWDTCTIYISNGRTISLDKFYSETSEENGNVFRKEIPASLIPIDNWRRISIIYLDQYVVAAIDNTVISVGYCDAPNFPANLLFSGHNSLRVEIDNVGIWNIADLAGTFSQ